MSQATRVVIVGAGHSGGRVALQLRSAGFTGEIVLVGEETELPYERPPLSKNFLVTEGRSQHAPLLDEAGWAATGVTLRLGTRALRLRPATGSVDLSDGTSLSYNHLVIATGAAPRRLTLPGGASDPRVVYLRTVADAAELRTRLGVARRIAVLGAGVIGLEVAAAARQLGIEVVVLESGGRAMARVVPAEVSDWIAALHASHGVQLRCNVSVDSIVAEGGAPLRIGVRSSTAVGEELTADLLLVAIGVEPSTQWLECSGLPLSAGVVVDAMCRSPVAPNCFAVGDVATTWNAAYARPLRQETWRNAENQARAVAEIICGRVTPYVEIPWMWSDQYDANIQMLGIAAQAQSSLVRGDPGGGKFCWIGLTDDVPVSAALVNCGRERRPLENLITAGRPVDRASLADWKSDLKRLCA